MPEFLKREKAPKWSLVPDSKFPVGHAEIGFIRAKFAIPDLGDELVEIHGGEATNSVPDRSICGSFWLHGRRSPRKIGQYGADHRRGRCQKAFAFWLPVTPSMHPVLRVPVNANNVLAQALLKAQVLHGKTLAGN